MSQLIALEPVKYVYNTYKALDFLHQTTEHLFRTLPQEDFYLEFEDGSVLTNERELVYSHFVWQFHREFSNVPLLKGHYISRFVKNSEIKNNTHILLINAVFWDVFDRYASSYVNPSDLLDRLSELYFEITNEMYNKLSVWLARYRTSLDILDFLAFTKLPDVEEYLTTRSHDGRGVDESNAFVMKMLREDPRFKTNPLAIAVRTGISREGQTTQILGHRGSLTDIDNEIFKNPIMMGYILGIRKFHDSLIESRSASKHLISSDAPLKSSEYFSRRQQLICSNVRDLHFGDCGSEKYVLWHVRGVRYEGPNKVSNGDLRTIAGKYYLDDETKTLKVVKETDTHLIGKTIKMRDPVAGCRHPNPYGLCMTCVGEVGFSLPKGANLGHSFCVSMTSILGQLILSTKHFDGSANIVKIVIEPGMREYLKSDPTGNAYLFSEKLKNKKSVKINVPSIQAPGLADTRTVDDVRSLNLKMTSDFSRLRMTTEDEKGETKVWLDVFVNSRQASFSHEFLDYVKRTGYRIADDDTYEIDLAGWDFAKVALALPFSHFNMANHQTAIAQCLESIKDKSEKRIRYIAPEDKLVELHDLVNREISVNLSVLSVVLYSSMIVDGEQGNYDLPKAWTTKYHGAMRAIMLSRSLSAQMAFQNHRQTFLNPNSFVQSNRIDHPFDGVILPQIYNDDPDGELTA